MKTQIRSLAKEQIIFLTRDVYVSGQIFNLTISLPEKCTIDSFEYIGRVISVKELTGIYRIVGIPYETMTSASLSILGAFCDYRELERSRIRLKNDLSELVSDLRLFRERLYSLAECLKMASSTISGTIEMLRRDSTSQQIH